MSWNSEFSVISSSSTVIITDYCQKLHPVSSRGIQNAALFQICSDIRLLASMKEIEEPFEKDQIGGLTKKLYYFFPSSFNT